MSDEDVRERSPLHEAAPRDWSRIGIQTGHPGGPGGHPGGVGGHARGLSHGDKYRTRKGKRNERDSTVSKYSMANYNLLNILMFLLRNVVKIISHGTNHSKRIKSLLSLLLGYSYIV